MRRAALAFLRAGGAPTSTSRPSTSLRPLSSTSSSTPSLPPRIPFLPPRPPAEDSALRNFFTNVASPTLSATALATGCCVAAAAGKLDADDERKSRTAKAVIGAVFGLDVEDEANRPPGFARDWPGPLRSAAGRVRRSWSEASPSERAVAGVAAANAAVFVLWRLPLGPLWRRFMGAHFVQRLPPGPPPLPHTLLTANFSHRSGWHLLANTLTLWSIGGLAARSDCGSSFGDRANARGSEWKFWAFFGAAGCASSLASHLGRLAVLSLSARGGGVAARLLSSLAPPSTATGGGSLGASGSLYACVSLAALDDPDTRVVVPFFEGAFGSFSIGDALLALVAVDVVGVFRGWRRLDHWGHLGGAAFGLVWSRCGDEVWSASLEAARKIRARARGAREEVERRRRERERERRREEAERRRKGRS